jgi:hypothetical protein
MSEPVDRLCDMLAAFDEKDRQELLCHCRMALGPRTKSINAILNPDIEMIRKRLNELIDEQGMRPEFLIPAVTHHLIDHFQRRGSDDDVNSSIDFWLDLRDQYQVELELPQAERWDGNDDAFLRSMIDMAEQHLAGKTGTKSNDNWMVKQLQEESDQRFPRTYWLKIIGQR